MSKVLHFTRKDSQLRASFIYNQIVNHKGFTPYIVYRKKVDKQFDGGFVNHDGLDFPVLDLSEGETILEKIIFKLYKTLSGRQKKILLKFIKENKIEICHFHYATDAFVFLPALKSLKIPKVVSVYGYESSGFPRRFVGLGKWLLKTRTFRFATKVFAMSADMKKDLITSGCPEEKVIVHYYGTDVRRFNTNHDYSKKEYVRFLIISGLVPQKGHSFLIKGFAEAYKVNQNIRLTIVGSGDLEDKIKHQVQEIGLSKVVSFSGAVVYGSKHHMDYFASHDVFVHPSITDVNGDKEGIPGAIVEAMAAGLPVISTYHAGIPFILENGKTGILIHEHDVKALTNAIIKFADSEKLQENIGKAGQEFAMKNLDLLKKEIELEIIYKELISMNYGKS